MQTFLIILFGLKLLLIGMVIMPKGLEALGQDKIKIAVANFTATPILATFTGMVITLIFQSSSAVTVVSIGLINGGLMTLSQGIGIVLGTNIGTTITAQLISFNITELAPYMIGIGLGIWLIPSRQTKAFGTACFGLGLVFWGLSLMETGLLPMKDSPRLLIWFATLGNNYLLALLTGTIATAIIQSGTAVIGLTLILAQQQLLTLPAAIAIMLGSNLGTCVTALIVAAPGTLDARRLALAHVLLNAIGALVFFPFIKIFSQALVFLSKDIARQIAHSHTFYNIICSLLFLPLVSQFAGLIRRLLPGP